jgi:hypothetical protein
VNEPRPEVEVLEPTTTRTGGRAARVAALATVVVLLAFVFIGVAGRPPTQFPELAAVSSPPPIAAASATALPAPSPTRTPVSEPEPLVQEFPADRSAQRPSSFVGAVLTLGGESYITDLQQVEPGHYVGAYRISRPMPASEVSLELAQMTADEDARTSLGEWELPLDPLLGYLPTAGNWLEDARPPDPEPLDSPLLAQSGYRIQIVTDSRAGFAVLSVDVRGGPAERAFADEDYVVRATINGQALQAPLHEVATGQLRASITLPQTDSRVVIEVARAFSPFPLFGHDEVSAFELAPEDLEQMMSLKEPTAVFVERTPANDELSRRHPRLLRSGHTLSYWIVPGDTGLRLVVTAVARNRPGLVSR